MMGSGAEEGHSEAQYKLGMMYEKGLGLRKNKREARTWLKKTAKQGITGP